MPRLPYSRAMTHRSRIARALAGRTPGFGATDWRTVIVTLAVGTVGAVAFRLAGLPAAMLSGAMVAVAAASMVAVPTAVPDRLRSACFFALGLAMAAGIDPQVTARVHQWPMSMLLLVLAVVAIVACVTLFLHRGAGWDRRTAFYAAMPGALSLVMALALRSGADLRFVAVSQSIRLFFLVAVLPLVLTWSGPAAPPLPVAGPVIGVPDGLLLVGVGAAVAALFARVRVPAAAMVGPFLSGAVLYATGLVSGAIPALVIDGSLVVLGAMIGSRFGDVDGALLLRLVRASLAALVIGVVIAVAFALAAVWATGLPFGQVLLAFAPGALEAMVILAFLFDLDPAFVATHHIARLVGMMLVLPVVVTVLYPRPAEDPIRPPPRTD